DGHWIELQGLAEQRPRLEKIAPLHGAFRQTDYRLGAVGAHLLTNAQLGLRLGDPGFAKQGQCQPEASAEVFGTFLEQIAAVIDRTEKLACIHVDLSAVQAWLQLVRTNIKPASA